MHFYQFKLTALKIIQLACFELQYIIKLHSWPLLNAGLISLVGKRRYNVKMWKTFTDCFNCLPVAAIIEEKIFCCHGGLSPDLLDMNQIQQMMRPTDVPDKGLICDLLWSDPDKDILGWNENERGVSFTFGPDVVTKFLEKHDLDLICRAHQVS